MPSPSRHGIIVQGKEKSLHTNLCKCKNPLQYSARLQSASFVLKNQLCLIKYRVDFRGTMMETQQSLLSDERTISEIVFRSGHASERTLQRRGSARTSNTRTRGENVRRARELSTSTRRPCVPLPVARCRRCARSRSRRTAVAPHRAARRSDSR